MMAGPHQFFLVVLAMDVDQIGTHFLEYGQVDQLTIDPANGAAIGKNFPPNNQFIRHHNPLLGQDGFQFRIFFQRKEALNLGLGAAMADDICGRPAT